MARLVIYGAGGFGREVMTATRHLPFAVLADDQPAEGQLRPDEITDDDEVVVAIQSGAVRRVISERPYRFGTVIAPSAIIGDRVQIGEGAIICDHAMITADATIGRHFHANIYSYVAHDCEVGDFVTLAPRASINGNVVLEDDVYVGTGAVLKQGTPGKPLRIGRGAVIGMGAVVTRDVEPGAIMVGNPARPLVKPLPVAVQARLAG